MDIHDISRYVKLTARARDTSSSADERQTARQAVSEMEERFPAIRATAARVEQALANPFPQTESKPATDWGAILGGVLTSVAKQTSTNLADEFAGHVTGARRTEPLRRGKCVIERHVCAPEQVCLEIRMNASDARRSAVRRQILDALEDRLLSEAQGE